MYDDSCFEWDERKSQLNLLKHGVSFELAARVFADPNCHFRRDCMDGDEERWHALGSVSDVLLIVVYVYRSING